MLPLFESGIPLVKQTLVTLPDADNLTIAYPDEGAWKRFHSQLGEYPEVNLTATAGLWQESHRSRGNAAKFTTAKMNVCPRILMQSILPLKESIGQVDVSHISIYGHVG